MVYILPLQYMIELFAKPLFNLAYHKVSLMENPASKHVAAQLYRVYNLVMDA